MMARSFVAQRQINKGYITRLDEVFACRTITTNRKTVLTFGTTPDSFGMVLAFSANRNCISSKEV
jgi:hypothetical protein